MLKHPALRHARIVRAERGIEGQQVAGRSAQRTVSVLSLGGTIAMTDARRDGAGVVPTLDVAALLTAIPQLAQLDCEITGRNLRALPGASLSFDDLSELVSVVREELDSSAAGVVITNEGGFGAW